MLLRVGNTVDFPIAFLACCAVDLVPVTVSSQLTARELADVIDMTKPALVIHDETLVMPQQVHVPRIGREEMARAHDHAPATPVLGTPERAGYIVFTSGTSGRPRAVLHPHRSIWARGMMHAGGMA